MNFQHLKRFAKRLKKLPGYASAQLLTFAANEAAKKSTHYFLLLAAKWWCRGAKMAKVFKISTSVWMDPGRLRSLQSALSDVG